MAILAQAPRFLVSTSHYFLTGGSVHTRPIWKSRLCGRQNPSKRDSIFDTESEGQASKAFRGSDPAPCSLIWSVKHRTSFLRADALKLHYFWCLRVTFSIKYVCVCRLWTTKTRLLARQTPSKGVSIFDRARGPHFTLGSVYPVSDS